jgi:hypothetical protein
MLPTAKTSSQNVLHFRWADVDCIRESSIGEDRRSPQIVLRVGRAKEKQVRARKEQYM